MLYQKRVDRALKYQHDQAEKRREREYDPRNPDREQPELADVMEKGDLAAMVIAGLVTIVPVALGALVLICLVSWLFMT